MRSKTGRRAERTDGFQQKNDEETYLLRRRESGSLVNAIDFS